MSERAVNDNIFICPFTSRPLKLLSKQELELVNTQIAQNQLSFYSGVPVAIELTKAFASDNHLYIYPVVDDILLLQRDTAVVPKNRTENPFLRVSPSQVDAFYEKYNIKGLEEANVPLEEQQIKAEELKELKNLLPKAGKCFVSAFTQDVDSILNLEFGTTFDYYFHVDYNIDRIRKVKNELGDRTVFVLAEINDLPITDGSIDALFSFDFINNYEKEFQHMAYEELKRALNPNGVSIVLYDKSKPMYADAKRKSDLMSKKALSYVAPWKKVKVPTIHFHPVNDMSQSSSVDVVTNTSLGRQLS